MGEAIRSEAGLRLRNNAEPFAKVPSVGHPWFALYMWSMKTPKNLQASPPTPLWPFLKIATNSLIFLLLRGGGPCVLPLNLGRYVTIIYSGSYGCDFQGWVGDDNAASTYLLKLSCLES
jgi:hypothetical protein